MDKLRTIFVTGGAGFIGSALIKFIINNGQYKVVNIDKLTYAGNLDSLAGVSSSEKYKFEQIDICNDEDIEKTFLKYKPFSIIHLAAESHVDRSIKSPDEFIRTNIIGTVNLLKNSLNYFNSLDKNEANSFRFMHVSTDEVYGDLNDGEPFKETDSYDPSSPYSASKASSDHFVRAWRRTYGLPTIITNCSNNYGPNQFPEKLIPHVIIKAVSGEKIPVYGKGDQIRDWLYVEDHARALMDVLEKGNIGDTYNIGGNNEVKNIDVVNKICRHLDDLVQAKPNSIKSFSELISFVDDRPGHDKRYAINNSKISKDLNWYPHENFESGILKTVKWYLANKKWWTRVISKEYRL